MNGFFLTTLPESLRVGLSPSMGSKSHKCNIALIYDRKTHIPAESMAVATCCRWSVRLLFQQEAFGSRNGAVQEMHGGEPEESQCAIPEKGDTVSEVKIKVPKGMLDAFHRAENQNGTKWDGAVLDAMLEAALRWLTENPIVPTKEQAKDVAQSLLPDFQDRENVGRAILVLVDWQRRMFLAPEPEFIGNETVARFCARFQTIGEAAIEAYRLGQKHPS